ncbi:MAG: hypothetical protein OEQ53_11855 [Saprospiraceae bacterium]|nr:hypothetical protein [Saprospiraceae bacterium]
MIQQFHGINEEEYEHLKNAVSLITVLIAGADGQIDQKEKEWAQKVAKIRSYSLPVGLKDFYLDVGNDFPDRLEIFIDRYQGEVEPRNRNIADELSKLNPILAKIKNKEASAALYESFISFAKHVARASGGFLAWGTVNPQEKRLIGLEMIRPIEE